MNLRTLQVPVFLIWIIAISLAVSCIHKTGPVTPWERVTTYNALLAQANNTVEQGAEMVGNNGALSLPATNEIITYCAQVASVHLQVTAVLNKGASMTSADTANVAALLQQIQTMGTILANSGKIGVKNPKSQQTFDVDVRSVVTLAQAVLSLIPQLNANPAPPVARPIAQPVSGGSTQ